MVELQKGEEVDEFIRDNSRNIWKTDNTSGALTMPLCGQDNALPEPNTRDVFVWRKCLILLWTG